MGWSVAILWKLRSSLIFANPNPSEQFSSLQVHIATQITPIGWTQCTGWINTSGDDVSNSILDGCLNSNNRLLYYRFGTKQQMHWKKMLIVKIGALVCGEVGLYRW